MLVAAGQRLPIKMQTAFRVEEYMTETKQKHLNASDDGGENLFFLGIHAHLQEGCCEVEHFLAVPASRPKLGEHLLDQQGRYS